jgi:hypothetical protein
MEQLPDTQARQDAIEHMVKVATDAVEAEEQRQQAHNATMRMVTDAVTHFAARMDRIITRFEDAARQTAELEEQARQDAQSRRIAAALDALTHHTAGELTTSPPVDEYQYQDPDKDEDDEPEDGQEREDTSLARHVPRDQGDLPRDLTTKAPPGGHANYPVNDPSDLDKPAKPPGQPVAVSLW